MQVSRAQNKHTLYASCVSVAASEWNASSRNTSGRQPLQIAGRVGCISSVEPAGAWRPVNHRSPPRCRYYSSRKQSHSPRASPAGSHARAEATGNRERLVWVPLHPWSNHTTSGKVCGLTSRSSGAPTAGHQARAGGTLYIFTAPGLASCRCRPLNSNVRRQIQQVLR